MSCQRKHIYAAELPRAWLPDRPKEIELSYLVSFHQISGLVPPERSSTSLAAGKRWAVDAVNSGAARKAEIRDSHGNLLFRYPDEDYS